MTLSARCSLALTAAALVAAPATYAQEAASPELRQRLAEQDARIAELEARLAEQGRLLAQLVGQKAAPPPALAAAAPAATIPASPTVAAASPAPVPVAATAGSKLAISGDARLRQEFNFSDQHGRDRTRTVIRARLRARYALSSHWSIGASLVTGDSDDPNSADVTLSEFDDDLTVALDQAWLRYTAGNLNVVGGKFPNPLVRTEMVWDGDVNPQGLAASYRVPLGGGALLDGHAIYFVVDEAAAGPDSTMAGGQLALTLPLSRDWRASLAAGYYAYHLHRISEGDAGDFRSNLMVDGGYLSGFHLLDAIGTLTYAGLGERWPLSLTADWVRNSRAFAGRDNGINVELAAGRNAKAGDWRLAGTYSEVGVDAVFAAFSHDNIAIATNYQMLGLTLEHALRNGLGLGVNLFHYRPLETGFAGANAPSDWLDRVRFNLTAQF
jgi:hypothetical protein